jgi:two-component system, NtrC family, nitrogen regulation sensor histidine kinase NtrY
VKSLRSRLILGSSLIAIVPLALVMFLLSHRIDTLVRQQAGERLRNALGSLGARLEADGRRASDRLEIVARDPQLKRLYLLRPRGSRDLQEFLAERRFLLGLDFLQVTDTSGAVIADGGATSSVIALDAGDVARHAHARSSAPAGFVRESLDGRAGLALTAVTEIPYEDQIVGALRGGQVLDSAFLEQLKQANGIDLILRASDGRTLASTVASAGAVHLGFADSIARVTLDGRSFLGRTFAIGGAYPEASIVGLVSTLPADRAVAALDASAALLGILGLILAILLGVFWSSQVSGPVERLAAYSRLLSEGKWDEPLTLQSVRELQTLVGALDRMRADLTTYRDRLLTSERQAAWGQMARKVAHEIKNPLTPIAISVADLKRSFELERPEFPAILEQAVRTIGEEIERLRGLLNEFAEFGRFPAPRFATCRMLSLLADLGVLYGRELAEGKLKIVLPPSEILFDADAGQMRQALVNLIRNALDAVSAGGDVTISAATSGEHVEIAVSDTGPGLDAVQRKQLFVPGFTTKSAGSGFGLTIVERIVNDHRGSIVLDPPAARGTTFRIRLPRTARAS